jgi:urea transport system ATP-binding protein
MSQRPWAGVFREGADACGGSEAPPLLEVRNLTKEFGGVRALAGVNLAINPSELICLIGPNGCGKTTLFNVVSGALPPTAGQVLSNAKEITGLPAHQIARLGIARKFQVPGIYPTLSVVENLEIPLASSAARWGPFGLLRADHGACSIDDLLYRFGLAAVALKHAGTLSHGQKQWLEIAMLLASQPRLVLLDEPTAGMTPVETAATADLIRRIQQESGVAVLVIEHDMNFVRRLNCPVVVMIRGAVVCRGAYTDVQANPLVREAYLGQVT